MCAHAVRVAMNKVPGVTAVNVSLESATTTVELSTGNTVTLDQLRQIIRKNGFQPGRAELTATGTLRERDGRLEFDVAPAKAIFVLQGDEQNRSVIAKARELSAAAGTANVEVRGWVDRNSDLVPRTVVAVKRDQP